MKWRLGIWFLVCTSAELVSCGYKPGSLETASEPQISGLLATPLTELQEGVTLTFFGDGSHAIAWKQGSDKFAVLDDKGPPPSESSWSPIDSVQSIRDDNHLRINLEDEFIPNSVPGTVKREPLLIDTSGNVLTFSRCAVGQPSVLPFSSGLWTAWPSEPHLEEQYTFLEWSFLDT